MTDKPTEENLWDIIEIYYTQLIKEQAKATFEKEKVSLRNVLFLFAQAVITWYKEGKRGRE